jgi:hypothetical protein
MKPYQDKTTGLWKWGTRGVPQYETKEQCSRAGMEILTNRLREIKDRLDGVIYNHGK